MERNLYQLHGFSGSVKYLSKGGKSIDDKARNKSTAIT